MPTPASPARPRVLADRRAQSLDALTPSLAVMALLCGLLCPASLLVGEGSRGAVMAAVTAGLSVVFATGVLLVRHPRLSPLVHRHPQEVGLAAGLVGTVLPLSALVVLGRPVEAGSVLLYVLAVGSLMLDRRYSLLVTLVCLTQFVAVAAAAGFRDEWAPLTMLLVCAAVLARVVHASRCRAADELARAEVAVLEAAVTDELTGLANRRGLLEAGRRLLGTRDPADPLSVLFLDVDGLKRTNDLLGHAMGDRLVAAAGAALVAATRPGDVVARLGGDEFAVLLPGTDAVAAAATLARLEATLARAGVTASAGTTSGDVADGVETLLERADAAMYATKQARRRLPRPSPAPAGPTAWTDPTPSSTSSTATTTEPAATAVADLRDLGLAGTWLHLAVVPAHLLLLPAPDGRTMAAVSVAAAAVFGVLHLVARRRAGTRWLHRRAGDLVAVGIAVLCAETVLYCHVVDQPWTAFAVVLAVVAAGGVVPSRVQAAAVCALTAFAWVVVAPPGTQGPEATWYAVTVAASVLVAALLHVTQARTLARLGEAHAQVRAVALTDELTGLPNRRGFLDAGRPVVRMALRRGGCAGVLLLDLDGLKQVNDVAGHAAGDRLIVTAAQALRRVLGPDDLCARLGGDEFTVLVQGVPAHELPARVRWVEAALAARDVRASVGAAALPDDGDTLELLLDRADRRMLVVKQRRREQQPAAVVTG